MLNFFHKTKDPVCGMKIDKKESKFSFDFQEGTYYFCSNDCQKKFEAEPEKYSLQKTKGECCH